jgi:hypothetical protein
MNISKNINDYKIYRNIQIHYMYEYKANIFTHMSHSSNLMTYKSKLNKDLIPEQILTLFSLFCIFKLI